VAHACAGFEEPTGHRPHQVRAVGYLLVAAAVAQSSALLAIEETMAHHRRLLSQGRRRPEERTPGDVDHERAIDPLGERVRREVVLEINAR
jgi:hypothetical protein